MTNDTEQERSADAWTEYWATGQQHSCFSGGKPLDTQGYWSKFFDALPQGASVLDLACGAGALTRQAASHWRGLNVTGADYASNLPGIEGAKVDAGVRLEALPYPDRQFDAAVSQFGIEYSDVEASLREVARVLAPGGQFAFMCHAAEGKSVGEARERRARLDALLGPDGLVEAVHRYGRDLAAATASPPDPAPVAAMFRSAAAATPSDETVAWCIGFLAEIMTNALRFEPAYVIDNAARAREQLAAQANRLDLMIAAARDAEAMAAMASQAEALPLKAAPVLKVIDLGGSQIAWWLAGVRTD